MGVFTITSQKEYFPAKTSASWNNMESDWSNSLRERSYDKSLEL